MKLDYERLDANARPLPKCSCEVCGYVFDCATRADAPEDKRPKPGDFSVCMKCGEIYIFTDDMGIRVPTIQDLLDAQTNKRAYAALTKTQEMIREKRPLG